MTQNPGKNDGSHPPRGAPPPRNKPLSEADVEPIRFEVDPRELEEIAKLALPKESVEEPHVRPPPAPFTRNLPPVKPSAAPAPVNKARSLPSDPAAGKAARHRPPPPPAPAARRARPEAPSPSPILEPPSSSSAPTYSAVLQPADEDLVIIPALTRTGHFTASSAAIERKLRRSIFYRRTMIPILLTCGLLLAGLGGLWFRSGPDSVVRRSGLWLPIALLASGAVLLLLAIINMAQTRHLMMQAAQPRSR